MNDEQMKEYSNAINKLISESKTKADHTNEHEEFIEAIALEKAYSRAFDIFCIIIGMPIEEADDLTEEEFKELIKDE